jgi:SAM-dependent methyltransferase
MNDWGIPVSGADVYEQVFGPAMLGEWASRGASLADPQPGEHVLDVACGTGRLTRLLAKSVAPTGRVVGLDLSPQMLAVARNVRPGGPAVHIDWCRSGVHAMPFEDDFFDVVCCAFGLMFFPESGAVREMRRVLKPGGRLMVMVWGSILKCPGQMAMRASWQRHFDADYSGLFDMQHSLGEASRLQSLVEDGGLRGVHAAAAMGVVRFPSADVLPRAYGAMTGLETDEPTRAAVIKEVTAALQPYVGADGVAYPIEVILASARK